MITFNNNLKTINIVCNYSSLYGGNFIPSILELCISLKKCYNVVLTFPLKSADRNWVCFLKEHGLNLFFISFDGLSFYKDLRRINKCLHVSMIYSHFISGLRIKLLYPFRKSIKMIIHVHSDFSAGKRKKITQRIKNFFETKVFRKDAVYIFVSNHMLKQFEYRNKKYIPNALCIKRTPCKKMDLSFVRKQLGITSLDTVFLAFGWSPYIKGIDVLIKAFTSIKKIDTMKLIIVHGKGDGLEQCYQFLKISNCYEDCINDKRIMFIPPTEDIFSLYELSDVFVSSSRSEGFPYSILEASYKNLLILCSDIPSVDWTKKLNNVIHFRNNDYKHLSKLLLTFSNYHKTSTINKDVLEQYSIIRWSNSILKIIDCQFTDNKKREG